LSDGRAVSRRARGPKGLARLPQHGRDPTFARWSEGLPIADEYAGSIAEAESHAAYRWAAQVVRGRDVLDVGSRAGHGAAQLLEAGAQSVVGVDHDPRAVETATRLYGARARFLHAELLALPLARHSFDFVTCFDALDDSPDPDAVITGLRRVLADDGLLMVSLRVDGPTGEGANGSVGGRTSAAWREMLLAAFRNVRLYRRRLCVAAAVAPADLSEPAPVGEVSWLPGADGEDRAVLAVASDVELPHLSPVATLTDFRDLRQYRVTLAAWEERARRAEADGSAKHWEFVAAREAQRRLRKRVHELEHRPLRILWRVLRGGPARLGQGPPIRASERGPEQWD
jgi:SAM-dependent methyltransferase